MAYISKTFSLRHKRLSAYEREMLSILFALDKWPHYFMNGHFKIRTDHQPLKFMMDQKLHTTFQQMCLVNLLPFDYEIVYKKGKDSFTTDALSRMSSGDFCTLTLSSISTDLLADVRNSWSNDPVV